MQFFIKQNSDIPVIRLKIDVPNELSDVKFNLIDNKTNTPLLINSEGYTDGNILCYKLDKKLTKQVRTFNGYFTFTYENTKKSSDEFEIIVLESFSHHNICCK